MKEQEKRAESSSCKSASAPFWFRAALSHRCGPAHAAAQAAPAEPSFPLPAETTGERPKGCAQPRPSQLLLLPGHREVPGPWRTGLHPACAWQGPRHRAVLRPCAPGTNLSPRGLPAPGPPTGPPYLRGDGGSGAPAGGRAELPLPLRQPEHGGGAPSRTGPVTARSGRGTSALSRVATMHRPPSAAPAPSG